VFEPGVFRAGALAARARSAGGSLRELRRAASQCSAAAGAALPHEAAPAGELPPDGTAALTVLPADRSLAAGPMQRSGARKVWQRLRRFPIGIGAALVPAAAPSEDAARKPERVQQLGLFLFAAGRASLLKNKLRSKLKITWPASSDHRVRSRNVWRGAGAAKIDSDSRSQRGLKKEERPVGVPAARGHGGVGGAETRGAVAPRIQRDSACGNHPEL
jgi:hypothetical protein